MVEKNSSNQSVDKMFSIIEAMASRGTPMRLKDIAEKSQVSPSTAMRILDALIANGYANQDAETSLYALSYKFLWIGNSIRENLELNQLLHPYLKQISRRTGVSSALALRNGYTLVFVDEVVVQQNMVRVKHYVGKPFPLYNVACGRVFLGGFSESELNEYIRYEDMQPITPRTVCTPEDLRRQVRDARQQGYAYNDEEIIPGLRCLAFPIYAPDGHVFAAISISGTTFQINNENKAALVDAVNQVLAKFYEECRYALPHIIELTE